MILEKLQDITKELEKSIQSKSIVKLPVSDNLVNDIRESLELINNDHSEKEEIIKKLRYIYKLLTDEFDIIEEDYWDSLKHSLANSQSLSDKYNIKVAYENLKIVVEALRLLVGDNSDIEKIRNRAMLLQEKMQQQQDAAKQEELEKKSKEEFSKYVNGTIDGISIEKHKDLDSFYAKITLKNDNKSTDIKISEFLNNDFCKKNNIAGFLILNSNQEKTIYGFVDKKVRYYDLGATVQYGIKFNWYVDGKECSITLGANSDGSIRIISDRPTDADLEKNKDVKIKVGNAYLSLADAVKMCRQQEDPSSTVKQASANEHCRPLARTA
ncbi:hypothetical protein [Wolbachia endosymbiont of Nilaparvata lugens]|nr:hypothetical protein [Wolbachia endosymbiont of Nilaparvata lugens]